MGDTAGRAPGKTVMTVIVPVYNKAQYLKTCIKSLLSQDVDKGRVEVLLVDDGSTDNSLEICRRLSEEQPWIQVVEKENGGVSSARNAGIERATGDYIMFLDADDSVNGHCISSLLSTFDEIRDETDVVGYNLRYCYVQTGKKELHRRSKMLKRTGLYYLDEVPYIAQTTMNICVRNRGSKNILFNTKLELGEDQLFITENLARKATYGFCRQACYDYVRDGNSTARLKNKPVYAFEDMMLLYNRVLEIGREQPLMRRYCYSIILYNIDWRLKGDYLFPEFEDPRKTEEANERLAQVMGQIPISAYVESPYLNAYHKAYLVKRFHQREVRDARVFHGYEKSILLCGDEPVHFAGPSVVVDYCMVYDGTMSLRGRLVCPSFIFEEKPALRCSFGGADVEVALKASSFDYANANVKTAHSYRFSLAIDLSRAATGDVAFRATSADGHLMPLGISFKPVRHNAMIEDKEYLFPDRTVKAAAGVLSIEPRKESSSLLDAVKKRRKDAHASERRMYQETHGRFSKAKRMWMYVDLPTSRTEGNALCQMLHDVELHDGIERVYISDFADELMAKYPQLKGKVAANKSRMHKVASLKSELVLASYLEEWTFMPFTKEEYAHYGDLLHKQERVYLQHGVLHAHTPRYFSFDRIKLDRIVASTGFEVKNLESIYCYPKDRILTTGAPRLDEIAYHSVAGSKRVLLVPSWRGYLVFGPSEHRSFERSGFMKSSFYQGLSSFVDQVSKSGMLEASGYEMHVKLHPNFMGYKDLFEFDDPRISLAGDVIDPSDYDIAITDFSSYVYDFIYAGSRVMYFLPDHVEFKAGLNQYSSLDLPYDEAFGPYCEDAETACATLGKLLDGSLPEEQARLYERRSNELFLHTDARNRDRLYAALKDLADKR